MSLPDPHEVEPPQASIPPPRFESIPPPGESEGPPEKRPRRNRRDRRERRGLSIVWLPLLFAVGLLCGVQMTLNAPELRSRLGIDTKPAAAGTVRAALAPGQPQGGDHGNFSVRYGAAPKDPELLAGFETLRRSRTVERSVTQLNRTVALPADITITVAEERPNLGPFYDSAARKIVVQPSYVRDVFGLMTKQTATGAEAQARRLALASVRETLYHEVGHALIDQLRLPVTGRSEDTADELAAYLTVGDPNVGPVPALGQVIVWHGLSLPSWAIKQSDLFDEHSLNQQRAYQLACGLVGHAPQNAKLRQVLAEIGVAISDVDDCQAEWEGIVRSWSSLLDRYLLDTETLPPHDRGDGATPATGGRPA